MEMEYNILVKKSTVCSLQVSHTDVVLLFYIALPLCFLIPLLVGNFRFRSIDAPCGALNDAPEFTTTVIGSIMFSSSDSLSCYFHLHTTI